MPSPNESLTLESQWTTRQLLVFLRERGFTVAADGDRLLIAPASRLTDADRAIIRDHKPSLLAILAGTAAVADPATVTADDWRMIEQIAMWMDRLPQPEAK